MEKYYLYRTTPFKDVPADEQMVILLQDNRIYSHIPNIDSWAFCSAIQDDFFLGRSENEFTEISKEDAYSIAANVKPYSEIVTQICLQDAGKDGIIRLEDLR